MSDEEVVSPSLLNLRDFRLQKKPVMSGENSDSRTSSPTTARRRIITIDSDSDGDSNSNANNTNDATVVKQNTTTNYLLQVTRKSDKVVLREQQVKYLIHLFPTVESFEVYEALSELNFKLEGALKKLSRKHKRSTPMDFEAWRSQQQQQQQQSQQQDPNVKKVFIGSYSFKRKEPSPDSNSTQDTEVNKRPKVDQSIVKVEESEVKVEGTVIKMEANVNEDNGNDSKGNESDAGEAYEDTRVFDSDDDSDVEISNEMTTDKKRVLEFMQTATPSELLLMPSCSKKKVEAIIASRPFSSWIDLIQKLQENKNLSTDLLNAAQQVLTTRNNIRQLMKKCTSLAQQLECAIQKDGGVKEQPKIMSPDLTLTSYQLLGLNWLAVLNDQDVNGILADEMGLGKTVQVIAFLAHLKEVRATKSTHLVVVPSSTLENWQNEFAKWCPDLKVLLYYGSADERRQIRFLFSEGKHREFDVVLTTYTMVSSSPEERKMFRITPMHYVVFDEAHMLKNMNTQRYESLIRIRAAKRILLTGTPLQNNLLELMSLLIFVMPNIFSEKTEDLKSLFQKTSKAKDPENHNLPAFEREQIEQAKRIMKPFVLRRLKKDVLQDLPKKTDHMVRIPMASTQEEQYLNLIASFKAAGNDANNRSYNGMTMMSDLRKLSNHPLLLRYHYQYEDLPEIAKVLARDPNYKDTVEQYIIDDLACMSDFEIHTLTKQFSALRGFELPDNLVLTSGKFLYMDKKLYELKRGGHRALIFSQYVIMLDVMEEYLKLRDYKYLRLDGSTPVNIRQQLIDEYTADDSIFLFLLSTRAGGLGINLTAADTVIIHDIDFNPYNDKQAEDRCHRMGQYRPVSIYRLISKNTIEEGMWQMTQEKLKLEKEITNDDYENTDVKSVVSLLSTALGIDTSKVSNLMTSQQKS